MWLTDVMFHNVVIVGKCAFPARVVVIVVEVESLSHEILWRLVRVMKPGIFAYQTMQMM